MSGLSTVPPPVSPLAPNPTGLRPKFLEKMAYANVTVDPLLFAPERS